MAARLPPVAMDAPRSKRPSMGPLTSQKLHRLDDEAAGVLAERLRHFVPRCVLERVVAEGPVEAAEIGRLQGAVGFFDISGFTKLGNDLAHDHEREKERTRESRRASHKSEKFATAMNASLPDGAELLTKQLNGMFGGVIEVIERYGGDIIKFVGDAMIVLWAPRLPAAAAVGQRGAQHPATRVGAAAPLEAGDLERRGRAALACALECVDVLKGFNDKLGIHIGLAMGDVLHVVCGGFGGRYESFLCGPACDASFGCADVARRGDVVACVEINHWFGASPPNFRNL